MGKSNAPSELTELRARLAEAEQTLDAIRCGEVDALVVTRPEGDAVYTLQGADYPSRMLLQEMSQGALTLLPDGLVLYCNKKFSELVGLPHERVIGTAFESFVSPEYREMFRALLREACDGCAQAEMTLAAVDGMMLPVYCSFSPVQIDRLPCLCCVVTDLTEQKRNEEILVSGALARSILEQAGEIVVVCDSSGKIIEASHEAHEFFGRNVLFENFAEILSIEAETGVELHCGTEGGPGRTAYLKDCLGGKKVRGIELKLRQPNGQMADFLMSSTPLCDSGRGILGCVFTLSDVTRIKQAETSLRDREQRARKQAEELEQQLIASGRLVSLGEITASMAHEFNNPLGIIMGFVDDLKESTDPADPNYQSLQIIEEESKRCQKIIQDLMEFARPAHANPCSIDIAPIIDKTLQMVETRLYKQKLQLTKAIEPKLPPVGIDPQQLEQVLVNLYLNALDAMTNGGKLMVSAARESNNPGAAVIITVTDTGMGIAAGDLPQIFKPFYTARKKSGLGLGLSICERIIK
ncbi:MAG TPA: PAS domain S-box protein, partial [Terriglobales bacterium]|nr:PAS domain S-box protein [Terriglobales bacterium]